MYKVKQKVWEITINKNAGVTSKYASRQDGVYIKELEILGVSKYKIVLNDEWFKVLDNDKREGYRKQRDSYTYLDDTFVGIYTDNNILGDGVFLKLYSTKPPTDKILNKMVAEASKEINKKYGFLFGGIVGDLYELVKSAEKE